MARSPGRRMRSLLTFLLAATTVPLLAQQERTLTIPNIKIQGEVMNLSWTGPTGAKLQADVAEYCTSIRSHMCTPLLEIALDPEEGALLTEYCATLRTIGFGPG